MLGLRLTKYQQIHPDYSTCCAANVYIFVDTFIGVPIVGLQLRCFLKSGTVSFLDLLVISLRERDNCIENTLI